MAAMSNLIRMPLATLGLGARKPARWRAAKKRGHSTGNQKRSAATATCDMLAWLRSSVPIRAQLMAWAALKGWMLPRRGVRTEKLLLAWRKELMEEVDRTVSHMKDEAANFPDPADRASQEEEFSLELRTRDRERKLIKKIDSTLELIENEDYGYCDACGVEIGIRRLEARPTATLCVDCKTLDEIKEKQIGG